MNNTIDNTKSRKNCSEVALYFLREQIIDGKLQPGEKIIENNISEKLNISRGPVRDALKQLAVEGLVDRWINSDHLPGKIICLKRSKQMKNFIRRSFFPARSPAYIKCGSFSAR